MTQTHSEKTSASSKSIGFDFQYYYFLYCLLNLKYGETAGLEVMDDVHTELNDDKQILVQLKHTIKKNTDDTAINLTTLDSDLWKTLSNWSKIISDENDNRASTDAQIDFLKKTTFILASNKSFNEKNDFINNILLLKSNKKKFIELETFIKTLKSTTLNETIKEYIKDILKLNKSVLEAFLKCLEFELDIENIIDTVKRSIKQKMVRTDSQADSIFKSLDSQIREDSFIKIKNGKKIIISFEDFNNKYGKHFELERTNTLKIKKKPFLTTPKNLEEQTFIKQLIEIGDINNDDEITITEFTRRKLYMENNLSNWIQEGELTNTELTDFEYEARTKWENEFNAGHRKTKSSSDSKESALSILDEVRRFNLKIASQELPTDMSNGEFYSLSDRPIIGWKIDWEKKYK